MEDLYSIHPGIPRSQQLAAVESLNDLRFSSGDAAGAGAAGLHSVHNGERVPREPSGPLPSSGSGLSDLMKAQIASHPRYPALLSAYIECRKVGAPPEMASLLEEIRRGNYTSAECREVGEDSELDEFMESYCRVLLRYKEELSKPLDEATSFLRSIQMQLSELCKAAGATPATAITAGAATSAVCNFPPGTDIGLDVDADRDTDALVEEGGGSTDEDLSCGELDVESLDGSSRMGDQELKEMLLKKYSGYLSSLRKEFLKKRKKGKLPKSARLTLLDWWNTHYRWPYPTEEEKAKLAEITGLEQKQLNNWFINQRKRHWKPSDDMRIALMEGVSGGSSTTTWYFDTRTIGP